MNIFSASTALTHADFRRWGTLTLWLGLTFSLLLALLIAWKAPALLPLVPLGLLISVAAAWLFRRPELNLYVTLAGFVLIAGQLEGLQAREILYGLYFVSFLLHWFIFNHLVHRRPLLRAPEDWALALFLLYAVCSIGWALFFDATLKSVLSEAMLFIMLAFYFPVKDVCIRRKHGLYIVLGIIGWYGLFVSVRNLAFYHSALTSAEALFQITMGRVSLNEMVLMAVSLGTLVLVVHAREWRNRILCIGLFVLSFASLIITQSRGYWIAFLLGIIVLFFSIDLQRKKRILLLAVVGFGGVLLIGSMLFPGLLPIIISGIQERFSSLATAVTSDISLINRFYETAAIWEYIKHNPVLGYGLGAPFSFFNIISDTTMQKLFIHNAYAGLWFSFGLVGLILVLYFWARSIALGFRLFESVSVPQAHRLAGLFVSISLIAEIIVANTSNPFGISDGTLLFALLGAIASGGLARRDAVQEEYVPAGKSGEASL